MGIEPTSSAWEAEVMAIIRRPQNGGLYRDFCGLGSGVVWMLAAKLGWLRDGAVASSLAVTNAGPNPAKYRRSLTQTWPSPAFPDR